MMAKCPLHLACQPLKALGIIFLAYSFETGLRKFSFQCLEWKFFFAWFFSEKQKKLTRLRQEIHYMISKLKHILHGGVCLFP